MSIKPGAAKIVQLDRIDSTNEEAKRLVKQGGAEGTFVIAMEQTAGKGSQGRVWSSPVGGVYLSAILRAKAPHPPTTLSILAGVAAAQTVRDSLPKSFEITVKWPNDVLLDGKKVAGILCESLEDGTDKNPLCVLGIGININLDEAQLSPFSQNPFGATSFQLVTSGKKHAIDPVAQRLVTKLTNLHELYWTEGFAPVAALWESNCSNIGSPLRFALKGEEFEAVCVGIDRTGALVLSNERGEQTSHAVGEIKCFLP
ncbi:MAG: biotin--[acetyl-CoA-carboxylase] ligase [Bdellovibrionales bacterium]|nr:biotin--[acetyl-CoA-carboxylase] ligase [Bdellovibrionales bacterium]